MTADCIQCLNVFWTTGDVCVQIQESTSSQQFERQLFIGC